MKYQKINGHDFYNMVVNASNRLLEESEYVNALNVFPVPDGDTGTNMSATFKAAVKEIEGLNSESIAETSKKLAKGALMGARGNSGVILSQILRGISKGLEGKTEVDTVELAIAFKEGSNAAYKAVMRPTEGTILSVIRAAAEAAIDTDVKDVVDLMEVIVTEAKIMLDKTPDLLPALKKAKVVDSGGMGLYIILKGMYDALKDDIKAEIKDIKPASAKMQGAQGTEDIDIKFGYCTEFIILADASKADKFRDEIIPMGDSQVVVGYEDVIKVHIHTNDPGAVLAKAVKLGELSKIKIDNMREEHREVLLSKEEYKEANVNDSNHFEGEAAIEEVEQEKKKYAFVAVAMGEGITNIFKDLGVDYVIEGGQTMNPSTQDIMECISKLNADHIFVLPNNKNIIMSANQAAEISDKDVKVIPTTTIPQGITCITMFNLEAEVEENIESLKEAMGMVKTGSVTYAVRDTEMDGIEIKEGNMLGLIEGKIKKVGSSYCDVAEEVLSEMIDEESELITILYGADVTEAEAEKFAEKIEEKYEDLDVQCYRGAQPLYYFLMSVE
ncbi:DAK2 domain-containing protein [Clostridium tertium]|uniref:DAK2 domain-containing protein n=1 Tax=Clostridium tertium TaxID=1559 RepID=UPI0034A2AD70